MTKRTEGRALTSTTAFKALFALVVTALIVQVVVISRLISHPDSTESLRALLRQVVPGDNIAPGDVALPPPANPPLQPHLRPKLPPLPPFSEIPNAEYLMAETLAGRPTIAGIAAILNRFLVAMHVSNKKLAGVKDLKHDTVIKAFMDLASVHLVPLEASYRGNLIFPIREDESIFISLASFREHLLKETLTELFTKAKNPDRLFVGAVVQNCFGVEFTCRTGAQVTGKNKQGRDMTKVSDAPPDKNGVAEFCEDPRFTPYCNSGQIRAIYINETESLGPAMARYYASKLWGGETYFMVSRLIHATAPFLFHLINTK